MKLGAMLGDIFQSLFRPPATRRYPFERQATPARLRGKLYWTPEGCTGCALCVKDCPAQAIDLITVDKAAKRFVMCYDMSRCTYCAQCVQSCRFDCLKMSDQDWELAAPTKDPFIVYYGNQADVQIVLGGLPRPKVSAPEAT